MKFTGQILPPHVKYSAVVKKSKFFGEKPWLTLSLKSNEIVKMKNAACATAQYAAQHARL